MKLPVPRSRILGFDLKLPAASRSNLARLSLILTRSFSTSLIGSNRTNITKNKDAFFLQGALPVAPFAGLQARQSPTCRSVITLVVVASV